MFVRSVMCAWFSGAIVAYVDGVASKDSLHLGLEVLKLSNLARQLEIWMHSSISLYFYQIESRIIRAEKYVLITLFVQLIVDFTPTASTRPSINLLCIHYCNHDKPKIFHPTMNSLLFALSVASISYVQSKPLEGKMAYQKLFSTTHHHS